MSWETICGISQIYEEYPLGAKMAGRSIGIFLESDWNAKSFQADFDPKCRRAQMRYMSAGNTGLLCCIRLRPFG